MRPMPQLMPEQRVEEATTLTAGRSLPPAIRTFSRSSPGSWGSSVSEMSNTHLHLAPQPPSAQAPLAGPDAISVLLADDHALMRRSLRLILDGELNIEVIAEADDLAWGSCKATNIYITNKGKFTLPFSSTR